MFVRAALMRCGDDYMSRQILVRLIFQLTNFLKKFALAFVVADLNQSYEEILK